MLGPIFVSFAARDRDGKYQTIAVPVQCIERLVTCRDGTGRLDVATSQVHAHYELSVKDTETIGTLLSDLSERIVSKVLDDEPEEPNDWGDMQ